MEELEGVCVYVCVWDGVGGGGSEHVSAITTGVKKFFFLKHNTSARKSINAGAGRQGWSLANSEGNE